MEDIRSDAILHLAEIIKGERWRRSRGPGVKLGGACDARLARTPIPRLTADALFSVPAPARWCQGQMGRSWRGGGRRAVGCAVAALFEGSIALREKFAVASSLYTAQDGSQPLVWQCLLSFFYPMELFSCS